MAQSLNTPISLKVTEADKKRIDQLARAKGMTVSELLRDKLLPNISLGKENKMEEKREES